MSDNKNMEVAALKNIANSFKTLQSLGKAISGVYKKLPKSPHTHTHTHTHTCMHMHVHTHTHTHTHTHAHAHTHTYIYAHIHKETGCDIGTS